jgi:hypothetical protein
MKIFGIEFDVFKKTIEDQAEALRKKEVLYKELSNKEQAIKKERMTLKAEIQKDQQEVRHGIQLIKFGPGKESKPGKQAESKPNAGNSNSD